MTDPARVGDVLPGVVAEVVDRAGHGYDRWAELVAQAGYCHHPIRLRRPGRARRPRDRRGPHGLRHRRRSRTGCSSRRAAPGGSPRCPSCAATYRADAYQLLAAGLKGGKGVPETVAVPSAAVRDLHRPSLRPGPHAVRPRGGWCCPAIRTGRVPAARMATGMAAGTATTPTTLAWASRSCPPATTPRRRCCGTPWRPSCGGGPPSPSSVPWGGWSASRRASCAGWSGSPTPRWPSSSGAGRSTSTPSSAWTRPPTAAAPAAWPRRPRASPPSLLEEALQQAVPAVRVPCPSSGRGGPDRYARWGEQLDVRNITDGDDQAGELSAEQVAGYIAKYATKATESFGAGLDRRIERRRPGPPGRAAGACGRVRPGLLGAGRLGRSSQGLRLRAWAHMLGFGGHWSTKSRRYSTTMGALRRARVAFAKRRRAEDGVPLDAWGRAEDDQAVIVVAYLELRRLRLRDRGGARGWPLSAAARAREQRRWPGRNYDHDDRAA